VLKKGTLTCWLEEFKGVFVKGLTFIDLAVLGI
jgi:hypothetical protein